MESVTVTTVIVDPYGTGSGSVELGHLSGTFSVVSPSTSVESSKKGGRVRYWQGWAHPDHVAVSSSVGGALASGGRGARVYAGTGRVFVDFQKAKSSGFENPDDEVVLTLVDLL